LGISEGHHWLTHNFREPGMMGKMDVNVDTFGDSTGRFDHI
jgi:hypothetical protein